MDQNMLGWSDRWLVLDKTRCEELLVYCFDNVGLRIGYDKWNVRSLWWRILFALDYVGIRFVLVPQMMTDEEL